MINTDDYAFQPEPNTLVLEDQSLRHGFVQLPKMILYAQNLTRDAKLLYAVLLGYAWEKDRCFPGYRRLCRDMQASENMVRKYMRELEAVGLLSQKRRGLGKTNIYTLHDLRTAKIEVLEPQFSDAPEPAKSAGKVEEEEIETERNRSNIRNATNEKKMIDGRVNGTGAASSKEVVRGKRDAAFAQPLLAVRPNDRSSDHPARRATEPTAIGETLKKRRGAVAEISEDRQILIDYLSDFAREMNDEAPLRVSVTRALNLLNRSGVPRQRFIEFMFEARARTKEASSSIRKTVKKDGAAFPVKAKMPFFFATLEQLCGVSPEPSNQTNHSGEPS
jgi:Helix-turn-helix domain